MRGRARQQRMPRGAKQSASGRDQLHVRAGIARALLRGQQCKKACDRPRRSSPPPHPADCDPSVTSRRARHDRSARPAAAVRSRRGERAGPRYPPPVTSELAAPRPPRSPRRLVPRSTSRRPGPACAASASASAGSSASTYHGCLRPASWPQPSQRAPLGAGAPPHAAGGSYDVAIARGRAGPEHHLPCVRRMRDLHPERGAHVRRERAALCRFD